ncbi:MAG: hypothetical protein M3299_04370 [Thermoproteota archaeon]|nr:hypothetical protein [Thermoproteota archaeon]
MPSKQSCTITEHEPAQWYKDVDYHAGSHLVKKACVTVWAKITIKEMLRRELS